VYLDKAKALETKGLNEEFGFHINRPFYIRSRLPMQRVAECHGANNVWIRRWRKNTLAQQWYFDEVSKTIKNNQWKSHSLDIQGNGGSANVRCTTTNSRWWQLFKKEGTFVRNIKNAKVLDVAGGVDGEQKNVIVHQAHGKVNQQWDIVYVDEWKGEPTKGELNEKFGLYVERDFHIVSQLPSNRYLDLINNRNMVIKTPNGRNTQVWYFHQQSLTIRTRLNNQSWDIKSAGKTKDMQIWSTNSGWFQIFVFSGEHFCNIQESNRCLDVYQGKDDEG